MEKYDKISRKILFELDMNARIPETQLARVIGRSKESVRYRIGQLRKKGIIGRSSVWLDPTKLGFHTYKMYLKLANIPDEKRKFINHLKKERRLFWLGVADGAWDIGLTFFARSNLEFFRLQNEIASRFNSLIIKKYTGVLVAVTVCSKDFLFENPKSTNFTLFQDVRAGDLDEIDVGITKMLFSDSRTSLVQLSQQLNVSIDTIRNRIKKLERSGIIARYRTDIDFSRMGYEFFKTFLHLRNLSAKDESKLEEYVKVHPNIIHMVRQISPWDVELEIMVKNYNHYNEIIDKLRQEFANIIIDVESAIMSEDYVYPAEQLVFEKV